MPSSRRNFGDIGEREAERFLVSGGYRILDRNYRIKNLGEIDLVGEKDNRLTFFEVKTRDIKHEETFPIETSINFKKRKNMKRICQLYLNDRKYDHNKEWQADAVFVKVDFENNFHRVEHLENILWEKYY